jgi:hypothetical protein
MIVQEYYKKSISERSYGINKKIKEGMARVLQVQNCCFSVEMGVSVVLVLYDLR